MNNTKLHCSLNDTTALRNIIIDNPELPLLVFCDEEAWSGKHGFSQADVSGVVVEKLTLYGDMWLDKDDYIEELEENFAEEYEHLTDIEYQEVIDKKVEETEFIEAIVVWVG